MDEGKPTIAEQIQFLKNCCVTATTFTGQMTALDLLAGKHAARHLEATIELLQSLPDDPRANTATPDQQCRKNPT